jgi:hypothetical protein
MGASVRIWTLLIGLLIAPAAWAGPADEAALLADEAASEHCSKGWGEHSAKTVGLAAVLDALDKVQKVYQEDPQPFLLFYRGTLYKCLGQYEEATTDLQAFVAAERGNPAYAAQVKSATVQLQRSGKRMEAAGAGAAAKWIRRGDFFEATMTYRVGAALRTRVCTDEGTGTGQTPDVYPSRCSGTAGAPTPWAVGPVPGDGRLALTGFFAPPIGLGFTATGQWVFADESKDLIDSDGDGWLKNNSIDWGITHPALIGTFGPTIRLANWRSEGRATAVRIEPRLAAGIAFFEPLAGHYLWAEEPERFQTLGGEWLTVHVGGSLRVELQQEVGNRTLFLLDVRGVFFPSADGDQLVQTREAGGNALLPLEPLWADRIAVDGGIGVLFLLGESGIAAIGPDLQASFDGRSMTFPDGVEHAWAREAGDAPDSKVYSTQRLKASIVAGLTLHFGGGPQK